MQVLLLCVGDAHDVIDVAEIPLEELVHVCKKGEKKKSMAEWAAATKRHTNGTGVVEAKERVVREASGEAHHPCMHRRLYCQS